MTVSPLRLHDTSLLVGGAIAEKGSRTQAAYRLEQGAHQLLVKKVERGQGAKNNRYVGGMGHAVSFEQAVVAPS
jgi:hypothetical protein